MTETLGDRLAGNGELHCAAETPSLVSLTHELSLKNEHFNRPNPAIEGSTASVKRCAPLLPPSAADCVYGSALTESSSAGSTTNAAMVIAAIATAVNPNAARGVEGL